VPDQKVAWAATAGATNAGAVRFVPAGPASTMVYLSLEYEPEGLVEQVGDKLGIVERQVNSDLERFKALVEDQGYASGAWRGEINAGAGVGTPGVERAAASQGDSGKAGVSGKAVAAGVAAAAAAGVAAVAAAKSGSSEEETTTVTTAPVPPVETAVVVETVEPVPPVETIPPLEPVAVVEPVDPLEPVADDSVLADTPDTSTGKHHLVENDEGRPGPGV
jgi:hypothetical protein